MTQHSFWHVSLEGKIPRFANGRLGFVKASWRVEPPFSRPTFPSPFMFLEYTIDGQLKKKSLRLDMDKRLIIDEIGDEKLDYEIRRNASVIWQAVIKERRRSYPHSLEIQPVD